MREGWSPLMAGMVTMGRGPKPLLSLAQSLTQHRRSPFSLRLRLLGRQKTFHQTIQLLSQGSVVFLEFSPKLLDVMLLPGLARFQIVAPSYRPGVRQPVCLEDPGSAPTLPGRHLALPLTEFWRKGRHGLAHGVRTE